MGKGLSTRQVEILRLLRGALTGCTTGEVVEMLFGCRHKLEADCRRSSGYLCSPDAPPRRQLLHVVRRALTSLQARGLVSAVDHKLYGDSDTSPASYAWSIMWTAITPQPSARSRR